MRGALVAALALAVAPDAGAQACGAALKGKATTVADARYAVAYVVAPDPVVVGSHFVVEFAVCPRAGTPAPGSVRIDATMPEHRHGMNYRPTVTAIASGIYRAEGMLFHMPGRWDVTFDLESGGRTDRLVSTLRVE